MSMFTLNLTKADLYAVSRFSKRRTINLADQEAECREQKRERACSRSMHNKGPVAQSPIISAESVECQTATEINIKVTREEGAVKSETLMSLVYTEAVYDWVVCKLEFCSTK